MADQEEVDTVGETLVDYVVVETDANEPPPPSLDKTMNTLAVKQRRSRRRVGNIDNELQCEQCGKLFATLTNARKHRIQCVGGSVAVRPSCATTTTTINRPSSRINSKQLTNDDEYATMTRPSTTTAKYMRRRRDTVFQFASWQFDTDNETDTMDELWRLMMARNPHRLVELAARDLGFELNEAGRASAIAVAVTASADVHNHQLDGNNELVGVVVDANGDDDEYM